MKITKLKYLVTYIIILVLPLSLVAVCSYFIPQLNYLAFKTYYIYYGGISLGITSILILFLTTLFLKHNFKDDKKPLDNKYLIKINLIFLIFHLLISIISNILNYFNINNYFIFALYMFYPLLYFCIILFLEPKKLTKKNIITILLSIYLLWYLLIPLLMFLFQNKELIRNTILIKSILHNLFYNYLKYSLLVMPFISIALLKTSNEEKEKSVVHKFTFSLKKLVIAALILLLIYLAILIIVNR